MTAEQFVMWLSGFLTAAFDNGGLNHTQTNKIMFMLKQVKPFYFPEENKD